MRSLRGLVTESSLHHACFSRLQSCEFSARLSKLKHVLLIVTSHVLLLVDSASLP
jgi:hypothetical protein